MVGTNGATVSKRDAAPFFLVGRCDVNGSVGGARTATDAQRIDQKLAGVPTTFVNSCPGETDP
jgi:hypothetical protein